MPFASCPEDLVCNMSQLGEPDRIETYFYSLQDCVNIMTKRAPDIPYVYYDPAFSTCWGVKADNCLGLEYHPGTQSAATLWQDPQGTCKSCDLDTSRYQITAKIARAEHGAKSGQLLRYTLRLAPLKGAGPLPDDLALSLDLPLYLEGTKATVDVGVGVGRKQAGVVDTTANTVTWANFGDLVNSNAKARPVKLTLMAKVADNAPAYASLEFTGTLTSSSCAAQIGQASVQVQPTKK